MKKSFIGAICFLIGVVLSSGVYFIFPEKKQIVYNETQVLTQMIDKFKNISKDETVSFGISYYHSRTFTNRFYVNVNYGEVQYSTSFDSFEEMIEFISDSKKYYDNVVAIKGE
jgi:hypothetical protein